LPIPSGEKEQINKTLLPNGFSDDEAQKRLTQYGPNEIEKKKTNPLLKFLAYPSVLSGFYRVPL
jgi:H+-transporting ATPase